MQNYNITFGSYLPLKTIIHRIDPRIKLVMFFSQMLMIFLNTGFTGYVIVFYFVIFLYLLSGNSVLVLFRFLLFVFWMFLFLVFINSLFQGKNLNLSDNNFNSQLNSIWEFLKFPVIRSLYISLRIYLTIICATILTTTTLPLNITLAFEDLLKPLKVIGFPVHYLSIIISLVLRSFPMIFQEADIIIKAQASRGIDFYRGGFRDKIKSFLSLFIPLFVLSFQKAENLANAMDARYFNISKPRTRYHVFKLRQTDFVFLGVTILLIASLFLIKCNSFSFPTFGDWDCFIRTGASEHSDHHHSH